MNDTKEAQRAALHKTIWGLANDLRGAVEGWDFKSYVLGFLFYRFISEDMCRYIDEDEREMDPDFSYAAISDKEAKDAKEGVIAEKGYFILPSMLFENIAKTCDQDQDLNETLRRVFDAIEDSANNSPSEGDFRGLFADIDLNSKAKLGATLEERNKRLRQIIHGIDQLDFGSLTDAKIDMFGDAYEYLMNMYASSAGKSGGEFFTPQEVSRLLARIAIGERKQVNKVYDPACGSGSLLLQAAKILGMENVLEGFYGQEINPTTYNLARINMFLHGVNFDKFDIKLGDTLLSPKHGDDEPFDMIVSNPPYSVKWAGKSDPTLLNDGRFSPAGVLAPKAYADLAFTMHMFSWLSSDGTAAIVEFPGVLYRGNAEEQIRQYLVDNNFVSAVIQLPANLFFGVTIATCIIVLKKNKADDKVQFIDASDEFEHVGNKNKLMPANIDRIYDAVRDRQDEDHFSKLVSIEQLGGDNHYNLSVSTWVEKEDTSEKIDIHELNAHIESIVEREMQLRGQIDAIVKDLEA